MKRLINYFAYSFGALAALTGLAAALSPVESLVVPDLPDITLAGAGRSVERGNVEALAARFDLSDLPPAKPPEPPPADPAQHLRTFRFLGMASSGGRVRAMFADASGPITLKPGDELAGFALTSVEPARARFLKDGVEVELIVNSP